jgi:acetoin utilization deacetylase AcuC-like enzyme
LLVSHERCLEHLSGAGHPERPARLTAVLEGVREAGLADAVTPVTSRLATVDELARVHDPSQVAAIEALCAAGGGEIDGDTSVSVGSSRAGRLAAGSGLEAIDRLTAGEGVAAFCAVRPPGHHATPSRSMGFCLYNSIAIAAATLAGRDEKVLIVDFDAHHGNGTQEMFWDDPRVTFVSFHQWPLYPGTGATGDVGGPAARGSTINVALPSGATGDVYLGAVDDIVVPLADAEGFDWLLLSAGFDAHRADPLCGLGLSAGDFGLLTARLGALVPSARRIAFLEGGYDLAALAESAAACVAALAGTPLQVEAPTSGGPGRSAVLASRDAHVRAAERGPGAARRSPGAGPAPDATP